MSQQWFGTKGLLIWFACLVASLGISLFLTSSRYIFVYRDVLTGIFVVSVFVTFTLFFIALTKSRVSRFSQFLLINFLIMSCVYSGYTIWQNRDMIKSTKECGGQTYFSVERSHLDFAPPQVEKARSVFGVIAIIDINNNCL